MARHGPHEELRRGELRLRCRSHRRHRVVLPLHLLPRGGARGPYHHDPHGGGGAHAHRHLQGARLLAGAHHVEVPHLRRPGRRARQRSRHRGALPGAALGHHGGLLHRLLRAPRRHAHRLAHRARRGRTRHRHNALGHLGCRRGHPARDPGRPHAAAGAQGRQAHSAGARRAPVAPSLVLVEGDVPQHLPLQAPSRHDVRGYCRLHSASADGPGAAEFHQRHHRRAVRRAGGLQRRHLREGRRRRRRARGCRRPSGRRREAARGRPCHRDLHDRPGRRWHRGHDHHCGAVRPRGVQGAVALPHPRGPR